MTRLSLNSYKSEDRELYMVSSLNSRNKIYFCNFHLVFFAIMVDGLELWNGIHESEKNYNELDLNEIGSLKIIGVDGL